MKAKYCPICGHQDLIYPYKNEHIFKCTRCEVWQGIAQYEQWEAMYIIQKFEVLKKGMKLSKDVSE